MSIYRDTAADWHAAGWAPLPLPARAKMPPPDGWTGRGADYPSRADIQTWLDDPGSDSANLALRMPLGVIGIDVDHYAGKAGGDTLRALVAELGELPATYRLTSRDPGNVSGIRLYRVPDGYPSADMHDPGRHIDLIRPEHRYAVGPGSIHPEGRVYRLYGLDGAVVDGVIKPGDLPELPQAWAQRLTRAKPAKADRSRGTVIGPHFLDIPARAQRAASAFLRQVRGEEVARLPGAQPGERNNVAHAVVCTLLDFADSPWAPYSADDVERDLLEHAPIGGDFTEAEVRRILASAHNRESAGRGRSLPHIVEAELVLSDQSQGPAGEAAPTTSGQRGEAEKGEAKEPREKGPSQATLLAAMALERYDIRADDTGTAYALPKTGPHIARPVRGGLYSLRSELAKIYRQKCGGNVPTQSALTDAIASLEGDATDAAPVDFHLRVAKNDGALWLDLGDTTGRSVCITAAGWSVVDTAPVWFRRTELTGALPEPVRGGDLDELWNLVNIDPQDRAVVLGILAATLFPNIPHPVAVLLAEHGSGKSTAGSTLAGLLDPSPVPLRKPPKDEEGWIIAAWGSHVVAVDNVSRIPEWWSDSLCRASTGDGDVRRRLYTDAGLQVFAFRRVVWLTTIALEDMRDDLADRAVMLDLRKIGHRLTDHEMADTWRAAHPRLLGALLDLAVGVLRERPNVSTEDLPRMADFAQILRAVDAVLGTTGAARYAEMADDIANDVASGNPILDALHIAARQTLPMLTSAELLGRIDAAWGPDRPRGKTWPRDARAMTAQLTRAKPTLERLGWSVVKHERGGHDRTVRWTITPPARDAE